MLRVALLGIVVIACACHRDNPAGATETGSASDPALVSTAAGIVREVSGTVTVAGQPVAVGARLAAGDVVTTGDGSRALIELVHNGAKWELGPNRAVRVADSIAWKLTAANAARVAVVRDMAQPNATAASASAGPGPANTSTTPQGAAAVLMRHRGALMRCLDASAQQVQLLVRVDADGKAKTDVPGASEAIRACLVHEVDTLTFPHEAAGVGIKLGN
jgi:hypothetical protein